MAIQNARSNNTGAAPASLADGQIALGQADGILFTRTSAGAVRRFLLPKRVAVADAAYTAQAFDTYVGIASLTASRAITLPAAASYPVGHPIVVADESGSCSSSVTLTLTAAGSDKINGAATLAMAQAYLGLILFSDGSSKWTAIAIPGSGGSTSGALLAANNLSDVAALGTAVANLQQPPAAPSASASLLRAAAEQDQYATGTITLTMPNGGAGWRSGIVTNDNASSGLITLAVPSGATLDGVANRTTVLLPYQRARVHQTGASAYRTVWIERWPIIGTPVSVPYASAVASLDIALPAGYGTFELISKEVLPTANGAVPAFRVSFDGGSTAKADANYAYAITGSAGTGSGGGQTLAQMTSSGISNTYVGAVIHSIINPGSASPLVPSGQNYFSVINSAFYVDTGPAYRTDTFSVAYVGATGRANLIRILASGGGNISGSFILRGIPQ